MSTATKPIVQHPTDDTREIAYALINRCMPGIADRVHEAAPAGLAHEAERVECLPPSPVAQALRAIVEVERCSRGGAR